MEKIEKYRIRSKFAHIETTDNLIVVSVDNVTYTFWEGNSIKYDTDVYEKHIKPRYESEAKETALKELQELNQVQ